MGLSVDRLEVSYGRIPAVRGISLAVAPGEIVALVGPNGAGKSTTLLTIAGALAGRGTVALDDAPLTALAAEARVARGISLVPEGREIFRTLTVRENLLVAQAAGRAKGAADGDLDALLASFPVLAERQHQAAGQLSGGEQQQLAIARALLTGPRYLLIDEPSLGLAPLMVKRVYDILAGLRAERRVAILVVEQSMRRVLGIADRVHVMREGLIVASFERSELGDGRRLEAAYFGTGGH